MRAPTTVIESPQAISLLNNGRACSVETEAMHKAPIVDSGETMPQKSTYFSPKLISGLVVNKIDPAEEIQEPADP